MTNVFVAYSAANPYHGQLIQDACAACSNPRRTVTPWSALDTSAHPIARSVEAWIEDADAVIADVSVVNANVTYEIGYAIGLRKPLRFIRSTHTDRTALKKVGLLDTLGHDEYNYQAALAAVLAKPDETPHWPDVSKNKDQPLFILQPPKPTSWSLRTMSAVKKIARLRFRGFNPAEISRLNATEAYEKTTSSFGVVAFWVEGEDDEAVRNNQRAAFIYGLARGRNIPALLISNESAALPLDLHDQADRWGRLIDLDSLISDFRITVADVQNEFVQVKPHQISLLEQFNCGDPVAENEAASLSDLFLETDAYHRTLDGQANVLVGRKGSGKTAVFLQVRDRSRSNKQNIVIDLIPDGHQLIKMKEFILDQLGLGARKEVVSAFWEYVLWLEIAYKLLEKDEHKSYRDQKLLARYRKLEELYRSRVDTGLGDFSERLKLLADNIVGRFQAANLAPDEMRQLNSSKVLEIIYGENVGEIRDHVLEYLGIKGFVFFLLDNLDRFWTPGGFDEDDALIVVGLTEGMQEISKKFRRKKLEFRWAIFVRSDVYEFLIGGMADYGKLAVQSLEWWDRGLMKAMFQQRLSSSMSGSTASWNDLWLRASIATVQGRPVLDYLVDGSLMRPRYLIRLFETARRRAITFDRARIEEEDYRVALKELGWQVLEDLDREIADLVPNSSDLLFELLQSSSGLTASKFRYIASRRMGSPEMVEKLLDVMLWNGSLGVCDGGVAKYIFDAGYKRQYLAALIRADPNVPLMLHPTLCAALD